MHPQLSPSIFVDLRSLFYNLVMRDQTTLLQTISQYKEHLYNPFFLYSSVLGSIYHLCVHQTKIHSEPLTAALNGNLLHKQIVHPLKHRTYFYIFLLEAGFDKKRAFHTGINRAKTYNRP